MGGLTLGPIIIAPHQTAPQLEGEGLVSNPVIQQQLDHAREIFKQRQAEALAAQAALNAPILPDGGGGVPSEGVNPMNILLLAIGGYVLYKML